jgi:chemotaxis protein CheD
MIGIGEYRIGAFPMATIGLGSCIGLVLFDPDRKVGALVHIMLPECPGSTSRPGKYADRAIPLLIKEMEENGSKRSGITARMAGGATMFETFSAGINIGQRNSEKIRTLLSKEDISIVSEDVGGKIGRSVYFFPLKDGKMTIRLADGTSRDL